MDIINITIDGSPQWAQMDFGIHKDNVLASVSYDEL